MPERSGRVVITSSTALEYAFESDSGQSTGSPAASILTAAIVEGLRTGDADRDHDGLVSVNDLYSYLYERVREATPHQSPEMFGHLRGDFIIARNPRMLAPSFVQSPSELSAHTVIGEELAAPSSIPDSDPESSLAYWTRIVEALREGSDKLSLASALNNVAMNCIALQRPEDAVSLLEESAAICRDLRNRSGELAVLIDLVTVYADLGYMEDSSAAERRVVELRRAG
jgi:hypothetical protein